MSLTEFTFGFKKTVIYGVLLIILYMIGKSLIVFGIGYYKMKNPVPIPPPAAKFSKLELPKISSMEISKNLNPVYVLDTKTGKFPQFPSRLMVFPFKTQKTTILSEQRSRDLAIFLGFKNQPNKISTTEFIWEQDNRKMTSNTALGLYSLSFDLGLPNDMIKKSISLDPAGAKNSVYEFLKINGIAHPDIESADVVTEPIFVGGGSVSIATGDVIANLTRVGFIRNIESNGQKYPIYTLRRKFPLISFFVGNSGGKIFFPSFTYTYWEIDRENGSEYGLNSPEAVWQNVLLGKGTITALYRKSKDEYERYRIEEVKRFVVKDIILAYIETPTFSKYLLPYYIFSGEAEYDNGDIANFDIYYTALLDSDISN
jgi:hypothetical protein